MRAQAFSAVGALCGLLSVVTAISALEYSGTVENCGVTTVYVTVVPTSSSSTPAQLSKTPPESSSGTDSTSTAHLTSTVHQTVFLTFTMTGSGTTRTETTEVTYPTGYTSRTYATIAESMSSSDDVMAASSSMTSSQATNTESGSFSYPIVTIKTQPSCSGNLVTCPETSVLKNVSSSSTGDMTSGQLTGSKSTPPVVYVIETLTVIPLASLPTVSSSTDLKTTHTIQTSVHSTMVVMLPEVPSGTPLLTSVIYATGMPEVTRTSPNSGSYPSLGVGGWNMSHLPSSFSVSSSELATIGISGATTTFAVDALSSTALTSTISSYSPAPINFSNSYILPNITSTLVAQSGFTASRVSSISLPSKESLSSGSFLSLTSTASSLSQITAAAWTESYSDENSATSSTVNIGQSTAVSMTGVSSSVSSATVYTATVSFLNSTTLSNYSSTTFSTSASITPNFVSAQSTYSTFSISNLSYLSSGITSSSSLQVLPSNSYKPMSTTYTTTITTSTSTASHLAASGTSTLVNTTSEAASLASASSELSNSYTTSSLGSKPGMNSYSSVPLVTSYETTSITRSNTTTAVTSSSTSSTSLVKETCTESIVPASSTLISSTSISSISTFITVISSISFSNFSSSTSESSTTALSATTVSPTSSSSATPTLCGEHGPFVLSFDDLPQLSVKGNSSAGPMPLFSPYHQFYFSDGWTIVPPPTDPYKPSSRPLLVEFLADSTSVLGYTGALGNGENALLGCFNFKAISMSLGCDSLGPDCDWQFTGLRFNNVTKATDTITTQKMSTVACPTLSNCDLVPVFLDNTFTNLTELRINVTVAGVDKIWWLDDLHLSWFDDSCDAGLCRQEHI